MGGDPSFSFQAFPVGLLTLLADTFFAFTCSFCSSIQIGLSFSLPRMTPMEMLRSILTTTKSYFDHLLLQPILEVKIIIDDWLILPKPNRL